ncbi:hypothetical protein BaRGS_00022903 [Batillaria attramentaria]|uniref:Uncharacterized protein n=1 Tax=Batillaria attramentaria TaxID=370345 RepID=A0ABD0KFH0_9CAEN
MGSHRQVFPVLAFRLQANRYGNKQSETSSQTVANNWCGASLAWPQQGKQSLCADLQWNEREALAMNENRKRANEGSHAA